MYFYFMLFSEPPLNFRPTYKLDPNSDEYDTGSKKRIPAWTDRILYMKKKGFSCTAYDSDQSLKTSDHRPVFASFSSVIEISKSEETDEPLGDPTAESDRPHPEFSSETQVCSLM
jgi:inositol polyphosphate 5-phosphatase INPP5B/F